MTYTPTDEQFNAVAEYMAGTDWPHLDDLLRAKLVGQMREAFASDAFQEVIATAQVQALHGAAKAWLQSSFSRTSYRSAEAPDSTAVVNYVGRWIDNRAMDISERFRYRGQEQDSRE